MPLYEKALKQGDKRKFELVLVCYDKDQEKMEAYMKASKMGFPGLKMSEKKGNPVTKKQTRYIPELVMFDADGKIVESDRAKILKKLTEMVSG